jgi:hypothetical protein
MHLEPTQEVAVHSYVFEVSKNGVSFEYAAITETHHPLHLTEADLRSIYGQPAESRREAATARQRAP